MEHVRFGNVEFGGVALANVELFGTQHHQLWWHKNTLCGLRSELDLYTFHIISSDFLYGPPVAISLPTIPPSLLISAAAPSTLAAQKRSLRHKIRTQPIYSSY